MASNYRRGEKPLAWIGNIEFGSIVEISEYLQERRNHGQCGTLWLGVCDCAEVTPNMSTPKPPSISAKTRRRSCASPRARDALRRKGLKP
jgi:hypothetical protein